MAITTDGKAKNDFPKSTTGAHHGFVWTAHDTNFLAYTPVGEDEIQVISKGISVDTAGTYVFTMTDGVTNLTTYLAAGIIHPIHCKRVKTGGTGGGVITVWL